MADTNIISLLDAYEAAYATTNNAWARSGDSDAAEAAHQVAIAAEELAIDNAIRELRRLEPELSYGVARPMIAIPAYRSRVRAIYTRGAKNG